jgi:hypothetical protein
MIKDDMIKEGETIDKVISRLLRLWPIGPKTYRYWSIFTSSVRCTLDIIELALKGYEKKG